MKATTLTRRWLGGPWPAGAKAARVINLRGDLFASVATFGGLALLKLLSSIVLTRLLYPEAYGVITMVASIAYMVEMLTDVGVIGLMVRHERGDERRFIDTLWTLRLVRGVFNAGLMFAAAPLLAGLYDAPQLEGPLRVVALWYLLHGLESMAFPLALRRQRARIVSYADFAATVVSTAFVIAWSAHSRDHWGMVYGMVVQRIVLLAISWFVYPDERPRFAWDREAAAASFGFARYVLPSSTLTLIAGSFDKFVFLKLFDIHLLGLYGLAASLAGPIDSLVTQVVRSVMFPRCAAVWREDASALRQRQHTDNLKLIALVLLLPAALAGAGPLVVKVLFEPRYAQSGLIAQAWGLRGVLLALVLQAESPLVASGTPRPVLFGNGLGAAWIVGGSLVGWAIAGFAGFVIALALNPLPSLLFYWWRQHRRGLLFARFEAAKLGFALGVAASAWALTQLLIDHVPVIRH